MNDSGTKPRTGSNMNKPLDELNAEYHLAERVCKACVKAAREGFMDVSISGLCTEGAMEAAISAIKI